MRPGYHRENLIRTSPTWLIFLLYTLVPANWLGVYFSALLPGFRQCVPFLDCHPEPLKLTDICVLEYEIVSLSAFWWHGYNTNTTPSTNIIITCTYYSTVMHSSTCTVLGNSTVLVLFFVLLVLCTVFCTYVRNIIASNQ
jgi:hypothetical protein